jgi:protein disulfide-isomerase
MQWKAVMTAAWMLTTATVALPTLVAAAPAHQQQTIQWQTDFEAACVEAQTSSKPILLFFTGSDWCGACRQLKSKVLDRPDFAQEFGDKYIFVEVDKPMRSQLPAALEQQNEQLRKQFGVRGFPTLILLDADQKQLGQPIVGFDPNVANRLSALAQ